MKKIFTQWKHYGGLLLFSLLVTLQLSLSAQTSHAVGVTNGTFTPDSLTIHVGDTVVWTNTQGDHNVNGTTATFPSNPDSFGNDVAGPGWVFSHVFTIAGDYDYHCDPHAEFGMVGKITVLERTSHAVAVTNGTFTPDSLTINVGDTVVWTNMQGNHNVNATTATFPSNPESFGNDVGAPGWVFSHVFTIAGVYDYHCDPHAAFGMVGQITVIDNATSVLEHNNEISELSIYPNPAIDQFFVSSEKIIESISIYTVTGAKILEYRNINRTELEISFVGIRTGVYLVDVQFNDNTSKVSRLIKR
jgi:plastocyanin